jgi:hypothetical protein
VGLRSRFDAALHLMMHLLEALMEYIKATRKWADALTLAVDAADVQLRDIYREARQRYGDNFD